MTNYKIGNKIVINSAIEESRINDVLFRKKTKKELDAKQKMIRKFVNESNVTINGKKY
ncbi:hypothetical protein [Companilactobacillus hulinensis]|uniref:hypothetical protein n=1 Tax=Companilactobacillus hulinensis TaxID=2486007 RepID=UPI0013DDF315|nr:hypothetical protein [Companilactobacillus hulinensis]